MITLLDTYIKELKKALRFEALTMDEYASIKTLIDRCYICVLKDELKRRQTVEFKCMHTPPKDVLANIQAGNVEFVEKKEVDE